MKPVDPRDTDEMARLMRIMNGEAVEPLNESTHSSVTQNHQMTEQEYMKQILMRFQAGAEQTVERLHEQAETNPRLAEAINTTRTPAGVKVGSWEIKVHESNNIKSYDVVNVHTGEPIAHDLTLYESALGLTKLLNKNLGITHPKVREVLDLEENFTRHRNDASIFKRKITRKSAEGDQVGAAIAEDRYETHRTQAVALREQLIRLCRTL